MEFFLEKWFPGVANRNGSDILSVSGGNGPQDKTSKRLQIATN